VSGLAAALSLLGVVLTGAGAIYMIAWLVRIAPVRLGARPFEGGLAPVEHAVSRFHVRWYAVTMLFLPFDMEMVFMYPWTRVISAVGSSAVVEMFVFLTVLLAGVAYACREGALRWA
jgi:NADH-quinone oxidoreductase subunit A